MSGPQINEDNLASNRLNMKRYLYMLAITCIAALLMNINNISESNKPEPIAPSVPMAKPIEQVKLEPVAEVAPVPIPEPPKPAPVLPAGSHADWMTQAGIAPSDFGYVEFIVMHEGHWNPCVINGGWVACDYVGDKAYGVCQALPGSKMASAGADWQTNPITQLKWCTSYAVSRYGSWAGAYSAWLSKSWW